MRRVLDLDRHSVGEAVAEPIAAHGHPVVADDHDVCRLHVRPLALPGGEGRRIAAQIGTSAKPGHSLDHLVGAGDK